jgi:putative ABC transport system permease protein
MDRRPPLVARVLLRLIPLGERRAESEADLLELFRRRAVTRGNVSAAVRYFHDVISLLFNGGIVNPLDGVWRDLRYAVRMFARQPVSIGVTVLGLGLAIGVSGSIFTLMNAALLKSNGVRDAAGAPRVLRTTPNGVSTGWDYDEYLRLREGAAQSQVEAWFTDSAPYSLTTTLADDPPSIPVAFVSGGYLQALGATAVAGRTLAETDAQLSVAPAVVISHAFWQRHLSADPAVVGRQLRIGRASVTVIGVMDRSFSAPFKGGTGAWMPISAYHHVYAGKPVGAGANPNVIVVTRLKPNVSLPAAETELTGIASGFDVSGDPDRRAGARFQPTDRLPVEQLAVAIGITVVIALVLLLACVNVATVLLANATKRAREIGVRIALGATRGRIVRQLLTESVSIASAASVVGLLIAAWMGPLFARLTRAPSTLDLSFDLTGYLFFIAVAFACGIGAGLVPARVGKRGDISTPLKGAVGDTAPAAPRRLRSSLLALQAASSILLLVLATLFLRAADRAARLDVGFDVDRLVTVSVNFDQSAEAARVKAYWAAGMEKISGIPGVERAALALYPPFGGFSQVMITDGASGRQTTYFNRTSANYFETTGLRVVRGRGFTEEEVATNAAVAVISETVARRHFPDRDPLGANLQQALDQNAVVIGIVNDAIVARLHEGMHGTVYQPLAPVHMKPELAEPPRLIVRAAGSTALVARPLRETLRTIDPSLTIRSQFPKDGLEAEVAMPRMVATVTGGMAVLAVVLAAIGLYGVTGAVVGQRTREIGVRMALGAERLDVQRLLVRESLTPVVIGLTVGMVLALIGGQVISGVLYGVLPYDPIAFGGAAAILLTSATLAVLLPTRAASRVDPVAVLRQE